MSNLKRWSTADAEELYNLRGWGRGYFGINAKGHVTAFPRAGADGERNGMLSPRNGGMDLKEIVDDALSRGMSLPLLIRFSDILSHRVQGYYNAFDNALRAHDYQGRFQGVYPLKVNQQRQVVEAMVHSGTPRGLGLEVGSRSELHAALAAQDVPGAVIVCNGFKDAGYVRLALRAQRLGRRIFLVVEKPEELELILDIARAEELAPLLGIRVRLVATGSGRWEDSGGDHSKFGLASWELMEAVERLRRAGALEYLQLLHAHIGSQITNIRRVTEAVREVARYYVELRRLGCPIEYVDVGGGLGVDYDGSRSIYGFSANYTEEEYAHEVVGMLAEVCRNEDMPHPHIVSESGRALTAHHSMLVVDVLGTATLEAPLHAGAAGPGRGADAGELEDKLGQLLGGLTVKTLSAHWAEAQHLREEANSRFELGYLSLAERARVDMAFWAVARRVERLRHRLKHVPEELESLGALLADKYYCNFSVFQSLPDAWAIGQEFPVMPLHRLAERPTRRGIVQDITCDSDGRLTAYIGQSGQEETLPLHALRPGEPYYLGIFLTGAYQEILGDLHNLFGDTQAIHVAGREGGGWEYEQVIGAETVSEVLDYVQFNPDDLRRAIELQVEAAVGRGAMDAEEGRRFVDMYARGLEAPTYLDSRAAADSGGDSAPGPAGLDGGCPPGPKAGPKHGQKHGPKHGHKHGSKAG